MNKSNNKTLAYELAKALDDLDSLTVYFTFVETYQEAFLRKILNKVMTVPQEQIKRSRGALFTYLVKQHGGNNCRN